MATWLHFCLLAVRAARASDLHRYAQPNPLPHSLGHVSHDHLWKGGRPACIVLTADVSTKGDLQHHLSALRYQQGGAARSR